MDSNSGRGFLNGSSTHFDEHAGDSSNGNCFPLHSSTGDAAGSSQVDYGGWGKPNERNYYSSDVCAGWGDDDDSQVLRFSSNNGANAASLDKNWDYPHGPSDLGGPGVESDQENMGGAGTSTCKELVPFAPKSDWADDGWETGGNPDEGSHFAEPSSEAGEENKETAGTSSGKSAWGMESDPHGASDLAEPGESSIENEQAAGTSEGKELTVCTPADVDRWNGEPGTTIVQGLNDQEAERGR